MKNELKEKKREEKKGISEKTFSYWKRASLYVLDSVTLQHQINFFFLWHWQVTVSLISPNEHAPKFSSAQPVTLDASEGLLVHSLVAQVLASDEDGPGRNGQLKYSFITPSDTFRINNVTGWIILLRPLDRETQSVYELDVRVTDGAIPVGLRKSATTRISIRVTDENDHGKWS